MGSSIKRPRDSSPVIARKRQEYNMSTGSSPEVDPGTSKVDSDTSNADSDTSSELYQHIPATPSSGSSQASASMHTTEAARSETDPPTTAIPATSSTSPKSPTANQLAPQPAQGAGTKASSQHVVSVGPNLFGIGLATRSTGLEQSQDGATISPDVPNGFRYPASHSMISYAATECFPIFSSGNVLIATRLVSPPREWRLQSDVLARHSSWFARSLQESMPGQSRDHPLWFSYTLEEVNGIVGLVRQPADGVLPPSRLPDGKTNGISIQAENTDSQLITSRRSIDPICAYTSFAVIVEVYHHIFGAFYSISPECSSNNVDGALIQAEHIVRYAIALDCLHLIRSHVGNALLQYRQSLFIAIKSDPARWLLLAQALQNDSIYTESLIHLIGAHPSWPWPTERSLLPEPLRRLITRKSADLDAICVEIEHSLLLLTIQVRSGPVIPQEDSQFNTWFIVATFRDILARQFTALRQSSSASLKRGHIFRQIRQGGSAYMVYKEMERLLKKVMPSAVESLSEDLGLLKQSASEYVKGLARNELMLDVEVNTVGYLTCSRIGREDILWRFGGEGGL